MPTTGGGMVLDSIDISRSNVPRADWTRRGFDLSPMAEWAVSGMPRSRAACQKRSSSGAGEPDPSCHLCGGILKSATISFGQSLVARDLQRAEAAAAGCDLLLAVGSTLAVYPAARLVPIAAQAGAAIVIVNGGPTDLDSLADVVVKGSISELLTAMVEGCDRV